MSRAIQLACAACGSAFVVVLFGGILAAGWIPLVMGTMFLRAVRVVQSDPAGERARELVAA